MSPIFLRQARLKGFVSQGDRTYDLELRSPMLHHLSCHRCHKVIKPSYKISTEFLPGEKKNSEMMLHFPILKWPRCNSFVVVALVADGDGVVVVVVVVAVVIVVVVVVVVSIFAVKPRTELFSRKGSGQNCLSGGKRSAWLFVRLNLCLATFCQPFAPSFKS